MVTKHLLPTFGELPIGSLDHPAVLAFLSDLQATSAAPGTVRNVRDVARLVFDLAVRSGAIKTNPGVGATPPRVTVEPGGVPNVDKVMALAEVITKPPVMSRRRKQNKPNYPEYGLARFAAWTGAPRGRTRRFASASSI